MPEQQTRTRPKRPPRLAQLYSSVRPFYFVTFNTHERRPILACTQVHETFRLFCHRAEKAHHVAVGSYVLMPDHVHLFAAFLPDGITLPKWCQSLRSVIGKKLIEIGHQKPHWQEGFFDHVLRSGESYAQKWNYVRMNPVRAGLCPTPEEWPYRGEVVSLRFD